MVKNFCDEIRVGESYSKPCKHTYFLQRKILKEYEHDLDHIMDSSQARDIVFEHVPLALISSFITATHYMGYFADERRTNHKAIEQELIKIKT